MESILASWFIGWMGFVMGMWFMAWCFLFSEVFGQSKEEMP